MKTTLFTVWAALLSAYCQEFSGLKGLVADEATNPVANAHVQLKHHKNPAAFKKVQPRETARSSLTTFPREGTMSWLRALVFHPY